MSLCLNISLQQLSKSKYFRIFSCIFPALPKTWGGRGQNAGCYTWIHFQLEGKKNTSALHFDQLHPELRGSQAISGLSLMCSILTHHRIKQHYWRLKCTAVICSYRCTYYRCLNAFVKLPWPLLQNGKDFWSSSDELFFATLYCPWLRRPPDYFKCTFIQVLQQVVCQSAQQQQHWVHDDKSRALFLFRFTSVFAGVFAPLCIFGPPRFGPASRRAADKCFQWIRATNWRQACLRLWF